MSIIIPAFNEAEVLNESLIHLQPLRAAGIELVLADGGSTDDTVNISTPLVDQLVRAPKGRARQMNAGAKVAKGEWLLFLHADTHLPHNFHQCLTQITSSALVWGFFSLRLDGVHWFFRCIEFFISLRSRITRVATGDQCLFIQSKAFKQVGTYPDIPLMEDVAISKKLRVMSKPFVCNSPVLSSSRRWERHGVLKTVLLMWRLRLAYFFGSSPQTLVRIYYD